MLFDDEDWDVDEMFDDNTFKMVGVLAVVGVIVSLLATLASAAVIVWAVIMLVNHYT